MLELDIVKVMTSTPDIYGVGWESIFLEIERVVLHSLLMQDFDTFVVVATVKHRGVARPELSHLPFIEEVMPIGEDGDETDYMVRCRMPPEYSQFLTRFMVTNRLFVEFPIELTADRASAFIVGTHKGIEDFATFAESIGMQYQIMSRRRYIPGPRGALSGLSDRQRQCLEVAYDGGYFQPRRNGASRDLGRKLGLTHSTFLEHLRKAQRIVFSRVLGR